MLNSNKDIFTVEGWILQTSVFYVMGQVCLVSQMLQANPPFWLAYIAFVICILSQAYSGINDFQIIFNKIFLFCFPSMAKLKCCNNIIRNLLKQCVEWIMTIRVMRTKTGNFFSPTCKLTYYTSFISHMTRIQIIKFPLRHQVSL